MGKAAGGESLAATRPGTAPVSARALADRAAAAVTASSERGIIYSQTRFAVGTAGSTAIIHNWTFGDQARAKWYDARGTLTQDSSAVVCAGTRTRRFVDHTRGTWQQDSVPLDDYQPWPGGIAEQVDRLLGRVPGRQDVNAHVRPVRVQGQPMFQVTTGWAADPVPGGPSPFPMFTDAEEVPSSGVTGATIMTVWIDSASYLPVLVRQTGPGGRVLAAEAVAWIPSDHANLAELSPAPVPPGFRCTAGDRAITGVQ